MLKVLSSLRDQATKHIGIGEGCIRGQSGQSLRNECEQQSEEVGVFSISKVIVGHEQLLPLQRHLVEI